MAVLVASLAIVLAAALLNAPGRASDAWSEFKHPHVNPGHGTERLSSLGGESRYQFWTAAIREQQSEPLTGTGSGTFQYWWTRDGENSTVLRDAHSLFLQTFGELGLVGLLLILAFVATTLVAGTSATLRSSPDDRPQLAAALAGCVAFWITAAFDWMWQVPVLPIALLLLVTTLMPINLQPQGQRKPVLRLPLRFAFAGAALAAIIAIAFPLSSTALLRQSEADAREGDLFAALQAAHSAQNTQPAAATPRLQQALLLERLGAQFLAAAAAAAATERGPTDWRTWMARSRIEAKRGHPRAALHYYREARSLNPRASLFHP